MHIPASIKRRIGFNRGTLDSVGCSDAQVLLYDDMVLKIQKDSYQWFLDEGLREVFKDVGTITDFSGVHPAP